MSDKNYTATDVVLDRICYILEKSGHGDYAKALRDLELQPHGPGMPVAWVASHENGRVRHFAKADGWSVEAVLFEPSIPATGTPQEKA